jgi:hypothetical protein
VCVCVCIGAGGSDDASDNDCQGSCFEDGWKSGGSDVGDGAGGWRHGEAGAEGGGADVWSVISSQWSVVSTQMHALVMGGAAGAVEGREEVGGGSDTEADKSAKRSMARNSNKSYTVAHTYTVTRDPYLCSDLCTLHSKCTRALTFEKLWEAAQSFADWWQGCESEAGGRGVAEGAGEESLREREREKGRDRRRETETEVFLDEMPAEAPAFADKRGGRRVPGTRRGGRPRR